MLQDAFCSISRPFPTKKSCARARAWIMLSTIPCESLIFRRIPIVHVRSRAAFRDTSDRRSQIEPVQKPVHSICTGAGLLVGPKVPEIQGSFAHPPCRACRPTPRRHPAISMSTSSLLCGAGGRAHRWLVGDGPLLRATGGTGSAGFAGRPGAELVAQFPRLPWNTSR